MRSRLGLVTCVFLIALLPAIDAQAACGSYMPHHVYVYQNVGGVTLKTRHGNYGSASYSQVTRVSAGFGGGRTYTRVVHCNGGSCYTAWSAVTSLINVEVQATGNLSALNSHYHTEGSGGWTSICRMAL